MSEPIVEPTAPVAAPAPAPTPTPETKPTPPADNTKALAEKWVNLVTQPDEDLTAPPKPVEKKPEPKPEPAPAPAAKTEKPEKPIKVRKAPAPAPETRPPVPTREEKAAPTAAAPVASQATPPVAPQDDATFEQSLLDEEKALLDDARAAEKILGEKYKGQATKTLGFLKEAAAKGKQVEAGELDKAEFQEWYEASRPKISPLDFRAIERARVKEEVTKEFTPKLEEERHARWVEAETPKIEQRGVELKRQLWNEALPKEVTDAATERTAGVTDPAEREKILTEVKKDYALELEVAEQITAAARDDIQEYYRLVTINPATGKPLKARNKDLSTPEGQQHDRIVRMAHAICEDFKATGGAELKRDGKWFATWKEWAQMTPEQRSGWWTFGDDDVIDRAKKNVPGAVAAAVKQRLDYNESRGFKRVIPPWKKPEPAAAPAPHNGAPPAPRIAPPPTGGGSVSTAAERIAAAMGGVA